MIRLWDNAIDQVRTLAGEISCRWFNHENLTCRGNLACWQKYHGGDR